MHAISPFIKSSAPRSLLDIGAGSPLTALPLAAQVPTYLAIEQASDTAQELRRAGLAVMEGSFPEIRPDFPFDLVLACHSMPTESIDAWPEFLSAAWSLTRSGGCLLIVTFLGARGDLYEIRSQILGRAPEEGKELSALVAQLEALGRTVCKRMNSYVEASSAADVARFLGPWLSPSADELEAIEQPLVEEFEFRYRVREGLFVLPIEHVVLSCVRP